MLHDRRVTVVVSGGKAVVSGKFLYTESL